MKLPLTPGVPGGHTWHSVRGDRRVIPKGHGRVASLLLEIAGRPSGKEPDAQDWPE